MIVLDTHAFVWFANEPRKLSPPARRAIEAADELGIAAISCFEIALLVARERLRFDRDLLVWLHQALALPKVQLLPLRPEIAVRASRLEWNHRDPADRLIVATANVHHAGIVSKDDWIRSFRPAAAIW
jgi:PIN domain nuclease of toxin-antitoxin system